MTELMVYNSYGRFSPLGKQEYKNLSHNCYFLANDDKTHKNINRYDEYNNTFHHTKTYGPLPTVSALTAMQ